MSINPTAIATERPATRTEQYRVTVAELADRVRKMAQTTGRSAQSILAQTVTLGGITESEARRISVELDK